MISEGVPSRDLAAVVVAQVGRLVDTGDRWVPYRLVDGDGATVEGVSAWFADLQAGGRSPATVRSYGMDLLRWFRFLWAVGVPWDRATRVDARDFCRWLQVAGRPARAHWRHRDVPAPSVPRGRVYAPSVRAHSETVLRGFYEFHVTRVAVRW